RLPKSRNVTKWNAPGTYQWGRFRRVITWCVDIVAFLSGNLADPIVAQASRLCGCGTGETPVLRDPTAVCVGNPTLRHVDTLGGAEQRHCLAVDQGLLGGEQQPQALRATGPADSVPQAFEPIQAVIARQQ